jgi:hypothetical protein
MLDSSTSVQFTPARSQHAIFFNDTIFSSIFSLDSLFAVAVRIAIGIRPTAVSTTNEARHRGAEAGHGALPASRRLP